MTSRFHQGVPYDQYLAQLHRVCRPASYLEIGTETGVTLALAQCPAVAIDPVFKLRGNPFEGRPETHLFQMTSDDFFQRYDLKAYLPGGLDFAFLDGMHLFEFLLRDLINVEKQANAGTIVAVHDCLPVNTEIADRDANYATRQAERETHHWWTGDVWKLLPILREYRPDLTITVLDCPPTGLVIVRGLACGTSTLRAAYEDIVGRWGAATLLDYGIERFRAEFPPTDSRATFAPDAMLALLRQSLVA